MNRPGPEALALLLLAPAAVGQVLLPPQTTHTVPRTNPSSLRSPYSALIAGDVDLDGHLDALLVDGYGPVYVFRGNGAGGFTPLPTFTSQLQTLAPDALPRLLDLDGDGDLDFLLGGAFFGFPPFEAVEVFLGDGNGNFASQGLVLGIGKAFSVADFDGDLRPDLVGESGRIALGFLRNAGGGQFARLRTQPYPAPYVAGPALFSLVLAGRFDADSTPDVLVCRASLVSVSTVNVLGGPGAMFARSLQVTNMIVPVQVAEFDGNGSADVLFQDYLGAPGALLQRGDGHLQRMPVVAHAAPRFGVRGADIDADNHTDIVAVGPHTVFVHLGDGAGRFPLTLAHPTPWPPMPEQSMGHPEVLEVGDFNEDGKPDVLVAGVTATWTNGWMQLLSNAQSTPFGVDAYGTGTPTCSGRITMWASPLPSIGTAAFHVRCANAPPHSAGITLMGPKLPLGQPVAGLGVMAHIGFPLFFGTMVSSTAGVGALPVPLPAEPLLIGHSFHLQTFWYGDASLGDTCSPGAGELASSRGLSILLQP